MTKSGLRAALQKRKVKYACQRCFRMVPVRYTVMYKDVCHACAVLMLKQMEADK